MWELVVIFGGIVGIIGVTQYFRAVREGALGPRADSKNKELESLREERKLLEARVQNLESIVCSVDLELNARLAKLASQQSKLQARAALPALAAASGGVASAGLPVASSVAMGPTLGTSPPGSFTPVAELKTGQKVAGRYTIERLLGHGGMGAVYLAADEKLGERVALKVVLATVAHDPAAASERFRREVAAARKVTHPNVIRIHDLVEDGELMLLSMEHVDGVTLATYLSRVGGALPLDEARVLVGQICDGLAAAHGAGVIHRDLKPGNVLLDAMKRVKVIDFGLAKATFLEGMTATGLIMGTPEYMAPEQVRGLPCDARTDLYALGALTYHLLAGRPPFSGDTPIAIGFAHVNARPRPLRELRPDVPEALEQAVGKALEKEPGRRFIDAAEMKRALGA
jgi:serine/threonine-protein kinase